MSTGRIFSRRLAMPVGLLLGGLLVAGALPGLFAAAPVAREASPPRGPAPFHVTAVVGPTASGAVDPAWYNVSGGNQPPGRYSAAMAYDVHDGYVLLFGGISPNGGGPLGDTWAFFANEWKELCSGSSAVPACPTEPTPTVRGSMVYDAGSNAVVLYDWGTGQTWTFANGSWYNASTSVHPPLQSLPSQIAFDPAIGALVLLTAGGTTWEYRSATWVPLPTVGGGPPGRTGAQLFFDPALDRIVLFGGVAGIEVLRDAWGFANQSWRPMTTTGYPPQIVAAAFDPLYGYDAVLTSAVGGGVGLWGFANGTFSPLGFPAGSTGPSPALAPAMAFDAHDGYLLIFSGEQTGSSGPTASSTSWGAVDPLSAIDIGLSRPAVVVGDTVRISLEARGGVLPYAYQYSLLPPGCFGGGSPSIVCKTYQAGSYPIRAQVLDGPWGSVSLAANLTIAEEPSASIAVSSDVATVGIPVQFGGNVTGGLPPFTFVWHFGDGSTATGLDVAHTYATEGTYNATLDVLNITNVSTVASVVLFVNAMPLLSTFSITPNATDANVPVTFSVAASGGTEPLNYSWIFGDGVGRSTAPSVQYSYPEPGVYRAIAWANDSLGATATAGQIVHVNADPVASILVSRAPYNLTTTLAAATTGGTAPFSYVWQLGDGSVVAGSRVVHVFPVDGSYTVRVTVRDGAGWTASQVLVLVLHPGTPPAPPPPWYETENGLLMVAPVFAIGALVAIGLVVWGRRRGEPRPDDDGEYSGEDAIDETLATSFGPWEPPELAAPDDETPNDDA